jgi:hypothetical protein
MNGILASGLSQAHASAIGKISLTGDNSTVQLTQTWRHTTGWAVVHVTMLSVVTAS